MRNRDGWWTKGDFKSKETAKSLMLFKCIIYVLRCALCKKKNVKLHAFLVTQKEVSL